MGFQELKVGRLKVERSNPSTNLQLSNLRPANQTYLQRLLSCVLLVLTGSIGAAESVMAQPTLSPCQPPQPDEYILLVPNQTRESQEQLQQALPTGIESTVCQYLDDTVTRIGSFRELEDANAWARYVNEIVGLSAFVVRPAPATPSSSSPNYNPQPLGEGYAVLVDYFNQPEVASQLRQILGSDVGLVSYGQRPYLLAVYTTNENAANSTLRELSDRGFWSLVVDSRRVTLLSPVVDF